MKAESRQIPQLAARLKFICYHFVVLCYWVGLVEPDVICRFDLVVLAYAAVDCRCYVVTSCRVQLNKIVYSCIRYSWLYWSK